MTRASIWISGMSAIAIAACGGSSNSGDDSTTDGGVKPDAATIGANVAVIPLTTPDASFYNLVATISGLPFAMTIDTGSTTVAVAGSTCTTCSSVGVSPLYTPPASAVDQHETGDTTYADNTSWHGEIYADSATISHGTPTVALDFVSITTQSGFFDDNSYQGIFGLGPPQNEDTGTNAYVTLAAAAGEDQILGFELCDTAGTMWLGGFDPSKSNVAPTYTTMLPIDEQDNPFYAINVDDLSIDGTSLGYHATDFEEPIVDTGTSLEYLPTPIFNALLAAINASPGYKAVFGTTTLSASGQGCVNKSGVTATMVDASLPPMVFSLPNTTTGGADVTISAPPSRSYLYDAGGGVFCLDVADGGTGEGTTFGDAFMTAFVTVVDVVHNRIGFAPDTGCDAADGALGKSVDRSRLEPQIRTPRPRRHHR